MVPAVAEALAHARLRAVAWERITLFDARSTRRHTYRVTLADGATIKARLTFDEERARQVCELTSALAAEPVGDHFARVLSRHGAVLLEEWIDGDPLPEPLTEARLREAAGLLARLHRLATVGGVAVAGERPTATWRARTEAGLGRLAGAGLLDRRDADVLAGEVRRLDPGRARVGLVHLDYCPENMIIDQGGRLRLIDNEWLTVDAIDLDLARAWYRGDPRPAQWALFEEAYHRHGGPGGRDGSVSFWRVAAVVAGALARLDHDPANVATPLARLGDLAAAAAS